MDRDGNSMVKLDEFTDAVSTLGFSHSSKLLFHGLDTTQKRALVLEDITFLDRWQPMPFLLAEPSPAAAASVRSVIEEKYTYLLTGWRQLLDKNAANRCNWAHFLESMRFLDFGGDVAGAWREFDEDRRGF